MNRWPWSREAPGPVLVRSRFPSPARWRVKARKPFWTTSKYGLGFVSPVDMSFTVRRWGNCQFARPGRETFPPKKNTLRRSSQKVQDPALNWLGFHSLAFRSLKRRLASRPYIALWINPFAIYTPFSFILFY